MVDGNLEKDVNGLFTFGRNFLEIETAVILTGNKLGKPICLNVEDDIVLFRESHPSQNYFACWAAWTNY